MRSLTRYAWLSVAAALVTMALKGVAAWMTGSLGLLSDARCGCGREVAAHRWRGTSAVATCS